MKHVPEFIANENEWFKNTDNIEMDGEPLFITNGSKVKIFHGDGHWTFPDDRRTQGNFMIANKKFDYNDGKPRFKTKEEIQDAIKVYEWLNS